jgi:hypothetical protein
MVVFHFENIIGIDILQRGALQSQGHELKLWYCNLRLNTLKSIMYTV